jgi:glycerate 2-kinase
LLDGKSVAPQRKRLIPILENVMQVIQNGNSLLENAASPEDRLARELALGALNDAIIAADPIRVIKDKVSLKGHQLLVGSDRYDLTKIKRIFVIGAGKACPGMAIGMQQILSDRITEGYLNVVRGTATRGQTHRRIKLNEASHPLPDEAGVEGARVMKEIVRDARDNDLVICLISGGGSSLMSLPRDGVTLDEEVAITKALLKAGATISELNAVRKHLSDIKGGWLAKAAGAARVLTLIISDVIGDSLDVIASGPTAPDRTTFADAIFVLRKYGLWDSAPDSVQRTLSNGRAGKIPETPKPGNIVFSRVTNHILFNNRQACEAAVSHMKKRGVASSILSTTLEGEASRVGTVLGSIANEMATWDTPIRKPAGLVAGGETTVNVRGKGTGGRNQETALGAALRLPTISGIVVATLGTDGVDGPTDAAGALADGRTILRARAEGIDAHQSLADNDSYHFFSKLGDLIFTGPTGTNVSDLAVIVALGSETHRLSQRAGARRSMA